MIFGNSKYNCKDTYGQIRQKKDKVPWFKNVWIKERIPKCSFIMWVSCKNKIWTRDRLK